MGSNFETQTYRRDSIDVNFPETSRTVRYFSDFKGDMIVIDSVRNALVSRERCTESRLNRLLEFGGAPRVVDTHHHMDGKFNTAAEAALPEGAFDIRIVGESGGTIFTVFDAVKPTNHAFFSETFGHHFYVPKGSPFLALGRYAVEVKPDGIDFTLVETVTIDNFYKRFEEPTFSVYICRN